MDSVAPAAEKDGHAARATPWVLSTYFAEGLPYSLVHQVAAQFFTAMGASLSAIGLTSLYGLAWNLKFAWAPLVDRYGTARRWLIGAQALLAIVVALLAWPASEGNLGTVARILVVVSILAATHDIAIDGFYLRALGKKDQAALTGLRVGAYRLALLVGNGLLVFLAGIVSWFLCFALAGAILGGLALLHALRLPRPQRGDVDDAQGVQRKENDSAQPSFGQAFATFFRRPEIVTILLFVLLFRAGDAMMFSMATPLLKDLGLETEARGIVSGVVGTIASIGGSVFGGALIARYGLRKLLFPIAGAQSAAILLFVLLAWMRPGIVGITTIVVLEQLVAGIGTAAFMVFLMRLCSGDYKASHFAISTALMSLATTISGSVSGFIADAVGFTPFFALAFAASLPGVLLSTRVPVTD